MRIADVAVIGPLMIWGGTEAAKAAQTPLGQKAGSGLALLGITTIAYNAVNFARIRRGDAC